jgi:16S rRNA (adenine1518-N6/adenine1519-N6)-dimethyltransferase
MTPPLGQHLLYSPLLAESIASAPSLFKENLIVEIGGGKGILSEKLCSKYSTVCIIEKDPFFVDFLKKKFEKEIKKEKVYILFEDIREEEKVFSFIKKIQKKHSYKEYHIIANIPYYITGFIIRSFLCAENPPSSLTFLVQKEVGERVCRKNSPKHSLLSLSVELFGKTKYIKTIKKGSFTPPPKVDSALITIKKEKKNLTKEEEALFFTLIRKAFMQKRKTLKKSLGKKSLFLSHCKIKENERPEDLSLEKWLCFIKAMSQPAPQENQLQQEHTQTQYKQDKE